MAWYSRGTAPPLATTTHGVAVAEAASREHREGGATAVGDRSTTKVAGPGAATSLCTRTRMVAEENWAVGASDTVHPTNRVRK